MKQTNYMNHCLHHRWLIGFLLIISLPACNTFTSTEKDTSPHYYEFTHKDGETNYSFIAKTSDPEVIAKVESELKKPLDHRSLHIHSDIDRGNDGYNNNWNWHFIPGEWSLPSVSAEVCDGRPGMVEDNLDYWIDQVGYFCPWSSRVLREVEPPDK